MIKPNRQIGEVPMMSQVTFRLTDKELNIIREAAKKAGKSVSDYVRECLMAKVIPRG